MNKESFKIMDLRFGGNASISIQSMTNTKTSDYDATFNQVTKLIDAGADLVRIAVPDVESVQIVKRIQRNVSIPICADIHFDYTLAIGCAEAGIPKIRINPGNIGGEEKFIKILEAAQANNTAIRIGVNVGSIEQDYVKETPAIAILKSIHKYVTIAENHHFHSLVLSTKSSDTLETIEINRLLHEQFPYPIHLGVTEAGTKDVALAKSYSALGVLLLDGIGNTIRISISGDPLEEIYAARNLLGALHLRKEPNVIACPTCARTFVSDLPEKAQFIEDMLKKYKKNVTFAVMGCNVNGPGECKRSDFGVTFGPKEFTLFKKGKMDKNFPHDTFFTVTEDIIKNL